MAEWNLQDILDNRLEKAHVRDLLSKGVERIRVIKESAFDTLLRELAEPGKPPRRLLERVQQLERELALARKEQSSSSATGRESRLLEEETKKRIRLEQESRALHEDREQMLRLKTELERKCGKLREDNRDLQHQLERAKIEISRLRAGSSAALRAVGERGGRPQPQPQVTTRGGRKTLPEARRKPLSRGSSQALLQALADETRSASGDALPVPVAEAAEAKPAAARPVAARSAEAKPAALRPAAKPAARPARAQPAPVQATAQAAAKAAPTLSAAQPAPAAKAVPAQAAAQPAPAQPAARKPAPAGAKPALAGAKPAPAVAKSAPAQPASAPVKPAAAQAEPAKKPSAPASGFGFAGAQSIPSRPRKARKPALSGGRPKIPSFGFGGGA